ncbi:DSPc-domain-containing protein [Basidiobolus meristosporus CBS 931.73]|uniref:DSPc-domain-containing protein n=1 Tax=Basidiobolus meristosporus CBS 931.73 TaxID=1314790 RepID=A0A1Y1Z429_9FUNG|nr:DSPc-domain-containing protein [Basidiobolus meristosporus CBS 931.73]|eukprot:ORY05000.1 DSPc-domain-containing protein [Basidiobolus meristosporus CBS 931.73]
MCEEPPVRKISAAEFVTFHKAYNAQPLPVHTLFPWLHAIDLTDYEKGKLFKLSQPDLPYYKGLVLLHSSKEATKCRLSGSVFFEEIITSTPTTTGQPPVWSFLPPQSLVTNDGALNLRNFASQIARYASISDIVVYSTEGDDAALEMAQKVSLAQMNIAQARKASQGYNGITYNTYVVVGMQINPFSKIEALLPELVTVDAQGCIKNYINYWSQEREECRIFTRASEVSSNVWVGNGKDAPFSKPDELYPVPEIYNLATSNPNNISICFETSEFAEYPDDADLEALAQKLIKLPPPESKSLSGPTVHMKVGVGISHPSESMESVTTRIVNTVQFIKRQAEEGRRILIYCGDGYSETSVLVLTYLMYCYRLTLPQAYFILQTKRSFSVAQHDLELLMCVEDLVWATIEAEKEHQGSLNAAGNDKCQINVSDNLTLQTDLLAAKEIGSSWFYNSKFRGSFPSRILPYLYLGDYNHATNPDLLRLLGITHILSAGEDTKQSTRAFEILYLDNLLDDGVDSLVPYLDECVEFIEAAEAAHKKVLVHCRVGVSRSASIVIAYLMKALKKSFSEAYLITRARRMTVVIQPNLRFVYELLMYERRLIEQGHLQYGSGSWMVVCKSIHGLNSLYNI